MKTTKPVPAASKPVAPKAPSKPAKPGTPTALANPDPTPAKPAKPGIVKAPSMEKPTTGNSQPVAAPEPSKRDERFALLLAEIANLKDQIQSLTKASEKASKINVRTPAEIVDGVVVDESDWRAQYHGATINVHPYKATRKGEIELLHEGNIPALLALPRDNDIGGKGANARNALYIAVHWERGEDGNYVGAPDYLTIEELATVWAD